MAEILDISPSHLSEIESGKANPNADFIMKLSKSYNISAEYLIHGRGDMFYDVHVKMTPEVFDFNGSVDTVEKLNWLVKNSPFFKVSILRLASVLLLEDEQLIKKSLDKNKPH